ncbi:hypothetical protein L1987_64079 [Smallanthus sonchifolius]|uniref:Uncharacterized protein n=1 Tax=Smallanthus sonchifolius TaxID=185202 RepID=A0ACB9CF09_9ASTR|nr:hypothetical protein L1987_64079 [Smallanthus sonchifolius]
MGDSTNGSSPISAKSSGSYTEVFAAVVAVINSKLHIVSKLLLKRLVLQHHWREETRNDTKTIRFWDTGWHELDVTSKFIAHLVNQRVAGELIACELLIVLLGDPTDKGVEIVVTFATECGTVLQDFKSKPVCDIFDRYRDILHEGEVGKRVKFLIDVLFALRRQK